MDGGQPILTETFPAPEELGLQIRFFIARVPPGSSVRALVALDAAGRPLERFPVPALP